MTGSGPGFDIFCRVVDNFGDIGVCWRLAKQLAQHTDTGPIRLWVDDLASFARIQPGIDALAPRQVLFNVELLHWTDPTPIVDAHEVVIEAFACEPPAAYLASMQQRNSLWINLEYLSAESWVQDCHGLPSLQANALKKYFYFPGFTEQSGGLLREPKLAETRTEWLARPAPRQRLLRDIGMPEILIERLASGWRQVFVFCYGNAPIDALAEALQRTAQPTVVIVPQGILPNTSSLQSDTVSVFECPFVDQDGFDRLLWSSDLNIVRGEDSLVRAIWAGKPFLWHIYQQEDEAHLVKLDAWLELAHLPPAVDTLMRAWNNGDSPRAASSLQQALQPEAWSTWRCDSTQLKRRLSSQTSLIERLLAFCAKNAHSG